jgi:LysM repeat protein
MSRRPLALTMVAVLILSTLLAGCRRSAVPPIEEPIEAEQGFSVPQEAEENIAEPETPEPAEEVAPPPEESVVEPTEAVVEEPEPVEPAAPAPTEEAPAVTPTEEAAPVIVSGATTYVVQPGDNLFRIAIRHGLSVQALAQANNITNPSLISVGQVLAIPASDGSGPTLPTQPPLPVGCTNIYVVKPGDNLFRIALRHNYSQAYLAQYNNITNPSSLSVGQQICIP